MEETIKNKNKTVEVIQLTNLAAAMRPYVIT